MEERKVDFKFSNRGRDVGEVNFVDDEELQSALARARRLTVRKQIRNDVEEIARAAREIKDEDEAKPEEGVVVLSATSEFVQNLSTAPVFKQPEPPKAPARPVPPPPDDEEESKGDEAKPMEVDEEVERGRWVGDVDEEMEERGAGSGSGEGRKNVKIVEGVEGEGDEDQEAAPIEEEPLVSGGLGATLRLLTQKGFVEKITPEQKEKDRKQKERAAWLAEQKRLDALRELEAQREKERKRALAHSSNNQSKGSSQSRSALDREREWEREAELARLERQRAKEEEERFKHYIPEVNLVYHDEFGRELNQKEAFRQLSHKFHGKHSGKMKTEKRIRRIEEEGAVMGMASWDTPLGTVGALQERTREEGKAHVVLSVGNRGVLPPTVPIPAAKPSTSAPKVAKTTATVTVMDTTRNVNVFNREK
ncbi:hypothetical protein HK097_006259, partial [Rhizophlyctis rosea]